MDNKCNCNKWACDICSSDEPVKPIKNYWDIPNKNTLPLKWPEPVKIVVKTCPVFKDIAKKCTGCKKNFIFDAYKQQVYKQRKWDNPKFCKECINIRHIKTHKNT